MGYPFVERLDGRAGQYHKQNLITQFGPEIPLLELRDEIATACRVYYVDLVPKD